MTDVPAYLDLSPTPEDLDFLVWILGGSTLLVALLKKGFEELLSLQLRLINIQGLVHAGVRAVINLDRNIPLVVRFLYAWSTEAIKQALRAERLL